MGEENNKKFIKIKPKQKEEIKIRGIGPRRPPSSQINDRDFYNKLTEIIDLGTIRLAEQENTFFLIDLNENYYSDNVKKTLGKLGLQIQTIYNPHKIFVYGNTERIKQTFHERLPRYIFKSIRNIEQLDKNKKIGNNLRQLLSETKEEAYFNIHIKLYNLKDFDFATKLKYFKSILDENNVKNFNYLKNTGVISCLCLKSSIDRISDSPLIKRIYLSPKAGKTSETYQENELIYNYNDLHLNTGNLLDLPEICIIDSGISELFNIYVSECDDNGFLNCIDYIDHGTRVSSLALFGTDLIEKSKILTNQLKILPYKIQHNDVEDKSTFLVEELINVINKYSNRIKVFTVSYNYYELEIDEKIDLINDLDRIIQENNVILTISAGNIHLEDILKNIENFPEYLLNFPVLSPSDGKNVFAVGSICKSTLIEKTPILSFNTRIKLDEALTSRLENQIEFFKPNIFTYGGNCLILPDIDSENELPVVNNNGDMVYDLGTSFATPLVASIFARLYDIYYQDYKNSETFKAIVLNRCEFYTSEELIIPIFYITDLDNSLFCNEDILINFEGELIPDIRLEDRKKYKKSRGFSINFFLPGEADSIDLITVHSSNYSHYSVLYQNTRLIVKITKQNGRVLRKKYGTQGRFAPITYGHYDFSRNYEGLTTVEVSSETRGVSVEELRELKIRFGISIKINLKNQYKSSYLQILQKVKSYPKIEKDFIGPYQKRLTEFIET